MYVRAEMNELRKGKAHVSAVGSVDRATGGGGLRQATECLVSLVQLVATSIAAGGVAVTVVSQERRCWVLV